MPEVCETCGKPITPFPVIIQGDSRKLPELLSENCVTVTSPPYGIDMKTAGGIDWSKMKMPDGRVYTDIDGKVDTRNTLYRSDVNGYGVSSDNIGNLKDKPLAVMSPPYQDMGISGGDLESRLIRLEKAGYAEIVRQYREGNPKARNFVLEDYGQSTGQIGKLK